MKSTWPSLLAIVLAGCATTAERNRAAAATWLRCPSSEVHEESADRFLGCGEEAVCHGGICRSGTSWQERFQTVASHFEAQFACPAASQRVTERPRDYVVQGCGRQATCGLNEGCAEFHDLPTLLSQARGSFSKETGCPAADVSVVYLVDGFRAIGCGRAANCLKAEGPCIAVPLPSCSDVAEHRYDECLSLARNDSLDANDKAAATFRHDRRQILQSIEGTVMANRLMEECRFRYEKALSTCAGNQAVTR